jgi:arginase
MFETFRTVSFVLSLTRIKLTISVYIGLRDVDAAEKKILREHGIKAYSMHEVDKYGIGKVVQMAMDHVNPNREKPIHLSFDVDALDPTVAPSKLPSAERGSS